MIELSIDEKYEAEVKKSEICLLYTSDAADEL